MFKYINLFAIKKRFETLIISFARQYIWLRPKNSFHPENELNIIKLYYQTMIRYTVPAFISHV